jgi:hypothetical protein
MVMNMTPAYPSRPPNNTPLLKAINLLDECFDWVRQRARPDPFKPVTIWNAWIEYFKVGDELGDVVRADVDEWDEFGYRRDGYYIMPQCGEPGCCRPTGPFRTRMLACLWLCLSFRLRKRFKPNQPG